MQKFSHETERWDFIPSPSFINHLLIYKQMTILEVLLNRFCKIEIEFCLIFFFLVGLVLVS